jgi:acyl dehydratase
MIPFFDDLVIGEKFELGSHLFTADEIKTFARAYDPQPFHTDEAAARKSHFGALCASGTHTAAIWMRCWADYFARLRLVDDNPGKPSPAQGPSPGYRDMTWPRPVFAGDVITYSSILVEKRVSRSRPHWGLITLESTGANQAGALVFRFLGTIFWERRDLPESVKSI